MLAKSHKSIQVCISPTREVASRYFKKILSKPYKLLSQPYKLLSKPYKLLSKPYKLLSKPYKFSQSHTNSSHSHTNFSQSHTSTSSHPDVCRFHVLQLCTSSESVCSIQVHTIHAYEQYIHINTYSWLPCLNHNPSITSYQYVYINELSLQMQW